MSSDLKSNVHQINLSLVKSRVGLLYDFENFRLDAEHLMLYRNGEEVSLTPKQVETLLALVESSGGIMSKAVLMSRLWEDAVVEESNLIQNIYILRKVLGETVDGKPMIETLRRRGYRFNAEVNVYGQSGDRAVPELTHEMAVFRAPHIELVHNEVTSRRTIANGIVGVSPKLILVATILILATVAAVVYLNYTSRSSAVSSTKHFAVLPLKPIGIANRNELYEFGVADSLINRLSSIQGFVVRPLSATRKYTEINQDPLAAGREQKADYVLASNYQLADEKIRVTSQLINVSTGKVEKTYTFEKDVSKVFAIQEAIAADFGNEMMAWFGAKAAGPPVRRGTDNEEAYRLYLQGTNLSEERGAQNVQKALEYLEQAVSLDPNYALAWAGIAHLHRDVVAQTDTGNREHYERSMEAIRNALAIDPNISDAYSALCHNKNRYEYDTVGAETACKRALELDPNSPLAHKTYANFLYSRGRFDEALDQIRAAMDLQPVSYRNQQVYGLTLLYARRYPEAEAQFKRLLELNPNHHYIHGQLALIQELQGRRAEAYEYLIKKLSIKKTDPTIIEHFKTAYARDGWRGVTMERIKSQEAENIPGSFSLACLYARLGDEDRAFEYLEKAFQERSAWIAVLRVAPQLDPLRDDPRFADLVNRSEASLMR